MSFAYKSPKSPSPLCCALVLFGLAGAANATIDSTERWVHTRDEEWCLIFGVRTVCLPTDYGPAAFENGFAKFRSQSTDSNRPLIDYESSKSRTLVTQVNSLLGSDAWVVGNTQYHGLLTIVEVSPSNSQLEEARGEALYVLSFGEQFTLTIHGRSGEKNENLARVILAQWQEESSHE